MKFSVEQLQSEMRNTFESAGLLPFLVEDSSRIADFNGKVFAEIVLSDGAKSEEARMLMENILEGIDHSLTVRAKWSIQDIQDLTFAYGPNGSPIAATLIPVRLCAGTISTVVTVAVTKLAQMEFEFILGRKPDLKQVAATIVESALRRGGKSAWDPEADNYLEIASGSVANVTRLLKKTA